jgi:hypothetical protein
MWARWLALAATVWTLIYISTYLAVVRADGNPPAWWYVALVAIGVVPLVATAAGWTSRPALVASTAVLGVGMLLGLLSIGLLLLPSVILAAVTVVLAKPAARTT